LFNRNNSNIANRASMFGGANVPGFLQNQFLQSGNQLAANQANNFNSQLMYANNLRFNAANNMMNWRPLQTGSTGTQTQTTSGLGTWLPQVAGMGLSLATMGMGGMGDGGSSFGLPNSANNMLSNTEGLNSGLSGFTPG